MAEFFENSQAPPGRITFAKFIGNWATVAFHSTWAVVLPAFVVAKIFRIQVVENPKSLLDFYLDPYGFYYITRFCVLYSVIISAWILLITAAKYLEKIFEKHWR